MDKTSSLFANIPSSILNPRGVLGLAQLSAIGAAGESQGNRQIQEEIKRDTSDDWAQDLYDRGNRGPVVGSQQTIIPRQPSNQSMEEIQQQVNISREEAKQLVRQARESGIINNGLFPPLSEGYPRGTPPNPQPQPEQPQPEGEDLELEGEENENLLNNEVINQVAEDLGLNAGDVRNAAQEAGQNRMELAARIWNMQREAGLNPPPGNAYMQYLRDMIGNLDLMNIASGAISSIPMIIEIYNGWRKQVDDNNNRNKIFILDGVPPNVADVDYGDPAKVSIEEVAQRPVMPHCKRHFYVDKDGKTKSVLVCRDEDGVRSYFNQ